MTEKGSRAAFRCCNVDVRVAGREANAVGGDLRLLKRRRGGVFRCICARRRVARPAFVLIKLRRNREACPAAAVTLLPGVIMLAISRASFLNNEAKWQISQ